MRYFGPESLVAMSLAKFWNNFATIDELIEFNHVPVEMKAANVKTDRLPNSLSIMARSTRRILCALPISGWAHT